MTIWRIDQPPAPVSAPATRRAEETDTRQAILRHDPEFEKKKKKEGGEQGFKDPYEDLADVSVPALKNFLLGLLERVEVTPPPGPAGPHVDRPVSSPQAAAAVGAYQRRATGAPPPPPVTQPAASALDLAAGNLDRAELVDLIRELDRLAADGVTAMALEKGDGFLASIRAGIHRVRNLG